MLLSLRQPPRPWLLQLRVSLCAGGVRSGAGKVATQAIGEMSGGIQFCPASAKRSPNRRDQAPGRSRGKYAELAVPKSRLLATREGVPFCGFRFLPGLAPRILGATKRRFEHRRRLLAARGDFRRLTTAVFSWYQFSREANSSGLRRSYSRSKARPPIPIRGKAGHHPPTVPGPMARFDAC